MVTAGEFHSTDGVEEWRVVVGDGVCAHYHADSLAVGARFAQAISGLPGVQDHRFDIDIRNDGVTVRLNTLRQGDYYGLTGSDIELARQISTVAGDFGLRADPSAIQLVQVTIDALAVPEVIPFWRAVLGYVDRPDTEEDVIDPWRRGPSFWFQDMDAPRPQRNRIHVDVYVPHDQAEVRVAAALAAGGRLVSDEHAPSWWVLADAEGNEVCVGTWLGRE